MSGIARAVRSHYDTLRIYVSVTCLAVGAVLIVLQ